MKPNLKWLAMLVVAFSFGLAWWAFARAAQPTAPRNLDDEALEIGKMLQCPVCQNVPVAFSPSQLAGQMRELIRKKLEAGESREQILQYFVDRYGESILFEPPKRGFNLLAWRGPLVAVLAGAIGLYLLLRSWAAAPLPPPLDNLPPLSDAEVAAYEARLTEALWGPEGEKRDTR